MVAFCATSSRTATSSPLFGDHNGAPCADNSIVIRRRCCLLRRDHGASLSIGSGAFGRAITAGGGSFVGRRALKAELSRLPGWRGRGSQSGYAVAWRAICVSEA
eukprot:5878012-Pyramimonas_sp.AAC.1